MICQIRMSDEDSILADDLHRLTGYLKVVSSRREPEDTHSAVYHKSRDLTCIRIEADIVDISEPLARGDVDDLL